MKAFHLDFNYVSRSLETVKGLLEQAAGLGYDTILWELEDQVQWSACPQIAHSGSWSRETFREILDYAKRLGLEAVPLLQTMGHSEYMLKHFPAFREQPEFTDCWCTSNEEGIAFQMNVMMEYLEVFGPVRFFHLGCDEAYRFGSCPRCAPKGKARLFQEHIQRLAASLASAGIRPCIWSDICLDCPEILDALPKDVLIWDWDYMCNADNPFPHAQVLASKGHSLVLCSSIKCWPDNMFVPNAGMHLPNVLAMMKAAPASFCVTNWSIRLNPIALSAPVMELPLCLDKMKGQSIDDVMRALSIKFFNVEDGLEAMALAGSPFPELDAFSGTQWTRLKDSSMPPAGYLESLIDTPQKRTTIAAKAEEALAAIEKGSTIFRRSPTHLAECWLEGCNLRRDFTKLIIACLKGADNARNADLDAFAERCERYFSLEETPASARKNARLVMAPFVDFLAGP